MLDTGFWYLVAFLIFIALAGRPLTRFIRTALDQRTAEIQKQLNAALAARQEAQVLLESARIRHAEASTAATQILEHAEREAQRYREKVQTEITAFIHNQEHHYKIRLDQLATDAQRSVHTQMVEIAVETAQDVIKQTLSEAAAQEFSVHAIKKVQHLATGIEAQGT